MNTWYDDARQQRLAAELDQQDTNDLVSLIFRTSRRRRRGIDRPRENLRADIARRIVLSRTNGAYKVVVNQQ
jgi:hypothetical protein